MSAAVRTTLPVCAALHRIEHVAGHLQIGLIDHYRDVSPLAGAKPVTVAIGTRAASAHIEADLATSEQANGEARINAARIVFIANDRGTVAYPLAAGGVSAHPKANRERGDRRIGRDVVGLLQAVASHSAGVLHSAVNSQSPCPVRCVETIVCDECAAVRINGPGGECGSVF